MAAAAPAALPFLLISLLLILFISCSAIAAPTHEGQGQQVPSSVTPKAAAVHYWHLQTRSNRPLPPIFLSKLSPLSPFKLITTNVETIQAMMSEGDETKIQKIDDQNAIIYTRAPHDRHASASGDMEKIDDQNAIIYTRAPHDHHRSASGDMEKIDDQNAIIYTHAPHDRHRSASGDMEKIDDQNAIIYTHDSHHSASGDMERIDDQNAIIYTHDSHRSASGDMERIDDQNAIIYTHAPHDRRRYASGDMEKIDDQNAIIYTHAPHDRHPSTSGDMEKINDQNAIIYTHADMEMIHDRHRSASGDMEKIDDQNAIIYTHSPHDRHRSASGDMEKIDDQNAIIYTHTPHDHHPSASDDMEKIDDQNAIIYTHAPGDELKEKAAEHKPSSRGIFYFRESELKEGKMIPSLKFVGRGSSQYFLPRSIASKIPFSASAVSKIFSIRTDSAMYRAMKTTVGLCRMPPNTGETKQCVESAEDMIDYALSTLGTNSDLQVWSTHDLSGFEGKSMIGKVEVVYDGELTAKNHVTCHKETFPYLVYACHNVFKTRVYDLEILDAETKERINRGAALCHLDTSAWSPDHASFAAVGSAPGKTEVCHWIAPWDMVWTAAGHVAE